MLFSSTELVLMATLFFIMFVCVLLLIFSPSKIDKEIAALEKNVAKLNKGIINSSSR